MNQEICLGGRRIAADAPVFIVAEMSANHLQDYDRAIEIIHAAKEAGAVGDDPAVGGQHLQPDYFKKLLLGASDGAGGSGAFGRMYGDRRIV